MMSHGRLIEEMKRCVKWARKTLEISEKTQGTTGPDGLKKSLKTQISASFFRAFLTKFESLMWQTVMHADRAKITDSGVTMCGAGLV